MRSKYRRTLEATTVATIVLTTASVPISRAHADTPRPFDAVVPPARPNAPRPLDALIATARPAAPQPFDALIATAAADTPRPFDMENAITALQTNSLGSIQALGGDAPYQAPLSGSGSTNFGFEVTTPLIGGSGGDGLFGSGSSVDPNNALAVGVENSLFGTSTIGFGVSLLGGNDLVSGAGVAATSAAGDNDDITLGAGVLAGSGGTLDLGDGFDRVEGIGIAEGFGDSQVEAYGVVANDVIASMDNDELLGISLAIGGNIATSSGVRVGTFEDNTIAIPSGEPLPNEAGFARLGDGANIVLGGAIADTRSSGSGVFFGDVNGVLVDVDSLVSTGAGADFIVGEGIAIDTGVGGGNFLTLNAISVDGVEVRGEVFMGDSNDEIFGTAQAQATDSFVVAEGLDFGFGNNLNAALGGNPNLVTVSPVVDLGAGYNRLFGASSSFVEGPEAGTVTAGVQNVGTILAGAGDDVIEASAFSEVRGGEAGIRGAIADGVQNFVINDALDVDLTGAIDLGDGYNTIVGQATARGKDFIAFATGVAGGVVRAGDGDDHVLGFAEADGLDEVGATGVLIGDGDLGGGNNVIEGSALADGAASTDARGITVGLSDIDDDSLQNPDDSSAVQAGQVGALVLGSGHDVLRGAAEVVVNAEDGDQLFFVGGNGIVNDGPLIEQLVELLEEIGVELEDFDADDINAIIDQLDVGELDTGEGDDELVASVVMNVAQNGQGADEDLEVIGDGIENAGLLTLGRGGDAVSSTVSVVTTIPGAKGLADAIDNSSVGIITGLGLEINTATVFDLGPGHDRFVSSIFASAVDDLTAADGFGNRGTVLAGDGDDTFELESESHFVLKREDDAEQQEGIADGWENRAVVDLGNGNDSVTTSATALGEGILTIAEGMESREFFDAGSGADDLKLTAKAVTSSHSPAGVTALVDNLTQAAGLQTEQIDEGEFFLGAGKDKVIGRATAVSAAIEGVDSTGTTFRPSTFAFGVTQMTADANNVDPALGTGLLDAGDGDDVLEGIAEAEGATDVAAFGLLFEKAQGGSGSDALTGSALALSHDVALAFGIAVGLGDDVFLKRNSLGAGYGLGAEAGSLNTSKGDDTLVADAVAHGENTAKAFGIDGANGFIDLGNGADTVTAESEAEVTNPHGVAEAFGIYAGTLLTGEGKDRVSARSNGFLIGQAHIVLDGGQGLGGYVHINLGSKDDVLLGFGAADVNGGDGHDTLQFEFSLAEFVHGGGVLNHDDFTFAHVTLATSGFERFEFNVDFGDTVNTDSFNHDDPGVQTFHSLSDLRHAIDQL